MARKKKKAPKYARKKNGVYTNKHGVVFTPQQKKDLELAIRRSNYRIGKLEEQYQLENPDKSQLHLMGKRSNFSITKQRKNLQDFGSMAEYKAFMRKQKHIQSGKYLDMRTTQYKMNYITAIQNAFGEYADEIVNKIKYMPRDEYRRLVDKESDFLTIGYMYEKDAIISKVENIRKALGLKPIDW